MPVLNRIAGFHEDMKGWRRHIHANPELDLECHETAAFVVERLKEFGITDIHTGIAKSGVVAIIDGQGEGPTIGLRADMDALPILEAKDPEYKSTNAGVMHACGHDGHTTMLLGAAKYLAETRKFSGKVALIFQPAEELSGGGRIMCEEGMMERFGIGSVYGIHNVPNLPLGQFFTRPGALLAAVDSWYVDIKGRGGHGAYPHETLDPVAAAVTMAQAMNTIVSRNVFAAEQAVVSVTQINAGTATNIIPDSATMAGTVRTFSPEVQDMIERRMGEIVAGCAAAMGVEASLRYERGYPATVNHEAETELAVAAAREVVGEDNVTIQPHPEMGAEDFAYMLEERPGAYVFLGIGEGAGLHHPEYDFNDEASTYGASFFARLVERLQPAA